MNFINVIVLTVVLTSLSKTASAQSFSLRQMVGAVIIDVGTIDKIDCPINGDYDCLSWPRSLFKYEGLQTICFEVPGEYFSFVSAAILKTKSQDLRLMIKSGFLGETYEFHDIGSIYECPSI